jgi:cytidine deaminase
MTVAFDAEDQKLLVLARSTRARVGASHGAAVRDASGRTYAAASVQLPSLSLSALQVAVAMAVSSGAREVDAAVVVGEPASDAPGVAAVRDLAPAAAVYFAGPDGQLRSV